MLGSSLVPFVLEGVHFLFMLFVFIGVYWCPPAEVFSSDSVTNVDIEFSAQHAFLE